MIQAMAFLALAGVVLAAESPLPIHDPAAWNRLVFVEDQAVSEAEACKFTMTKEGARAVLGIGPWRAGQWSARWQLARPLPGVRGTIRGVYRTEGPGTAPVASGAFFKGGKKLNREEVSLTPAESWTPFELVLRHPPPGADSVAPCFGLSRYTEGRAWFADLKFNDTANPVEFPAKPPPVTRPSPPAGFPPGARFRLEKSGDAWWLVTPEGRPFWSAGTDAHGFKKPPEGERMADAMRRIGFNSLGGWSNVWRWGPVNDRISSEGLPPFAAFVALETSGLPGSCGRLVDPAEQEGPNDHAFPDPFDPSFETEYRKMVADVAGVCAGRKWLAGWFIDNERDHDRLDRKVWSGHAGKVFRARLEERYGMIGKLNAAWGSSFSSFDDLEAKKPVSALREGRMYGDCREFAREIVKKYVDIAVRTVREADPGALVFSNRFMLGGVTDTLDYLEQYAGCDGITVNIYPSNRAPGIDPDQRAILDRFHQLSGKPVLIGEWSVPALDSRLYENPDKLDFSFPDTVETQVQRARQAACVAMDFYNIPFVVGAHWFTWSDFDSPKRQANRGLFTAKGDPWRELQDALGGVYSRLPGVRGN
jgi:hypothetical protein